VSDFEWTVTYKNKKNLKNQAYDPSQVKEGIFELLPGSEGFVALKDEINRNIDSGKYRYYCLSRFHNDTLMVMRCQGNRRQT
jgi:hypothetical protein